MHLLWIFGWKAILVPFFAVVFVGIIASIAKDAFRFVILTATKAMSRLVQRFAGFVVKCLQESVVITKRAIKAWVTKLFSALITMCTRFFLSALKLQDSGSEFSLDIRDIEIKPEDYMAEDYDDEYSFTDQSDCEFYYEEEEGHGYLSETNDVEVISSLRRSARVYKGSINKM